VKTVCLSSNTSWYLYNFRASTIRRLQAEGYHVVCIAPEDDYSKKLRCELACDWLPLSMNNKGTNPFREISLVYQFWRYYRILQPAAALHFTVKNNVYGTWAATAAGVPAINNVSGLGTAFIRGGPVSFIVRLLYQTSQPLAHRVFCQNEEDRRQLVERKLVPADRLELLPGSGVDLHRFSPRLKRHHEGPLRFLYAGRMLRDKGLFELVEATRDINAESVKCHLWLCGFTDVENVSSLSGNQVSAWASEPGVAWLGPSDAMEEIYAQVDCVVLPSYREGMPRSLLEAGAMGLPVIASDVPGCRHVVTPGGNGLLCAPRDRESLRGAMQTMLAMTDAERAVMGERGRALVREKFDEGLVVDATLRAVESAISHR
jgi:glycosyltransferase involved in cell wall biosynthesis